MNEEKPLPPMESRAVPRRMPLWKRFSLIVAEVALVVTLIFVIWATLLPTLKGVSPDAVRPPGRGLFRR
jgi:hypothetical protein